MPKNQFLGKAFGGGFVLAGEAGFLRGVEQGDLTGLAAELGHGLLVETFGSFEIGLGQADVLGDGGAAVDVEW